MQLCPRTALALPAALCAVAVAAALLHWLRVRAPPSSGGPASDDTGGVLRPGTPPLAGWASSLAPSAAVSRSWAPAVPPPPPPPAAIDDELPADVESPLVTKYFHADPSGHVFGDRLWIYCSHDVATTEPGDGMGSGFAMKDYRLYSMSLRRGAGHGEVVDHGQILAVDDVPWAEKQLWAPDAAMRDDRYYLYFPAKDRSGRFRIGVAVGDSPAGPFRPQPRPIGGSYSIDPAVFRDDTDGSYYMYFGGLWGGQLE